MQIHTVYTLLAVGIWVIVGTLIAIASRKGLGKGLSEYFIANRKIGGFVSALTYSATTYSAFMMIGLAGFTYKGGVGALGFELTYLAGLMLVIFFGPRFWLVGKKFGYVTPAELLGDRYQNKGVAFVAAVLCLIFLIPYSAVQLMGVAYLMEILSYGGIPFIVGLLLATIIAIVWAWIAGMRSVAWTDSLQALVMIITAITITFFVIYKGFGGFGNFFNKLELNYPQWLTLPGPGFFSFKVYLGLTLPWFFFSISNPQVSQRLFIPKSMGALKRMCGGFLIFGFVYTVITVLWGFSAKLLCPNLSIADKASPTLLSLSFIPTTLALIAMVAIMAAAISTIDSIMLSLSSMFAKDIYQNIRTKASEEKVLWMGVAYLMEILSYGGIPFIVGLLLATIIAIVWAWIAGMRSVAWTDSLQALVMIITAITITFFVIYKGFGGFGNFFNKLELNYPQWLTLPGPGFFSFKVYLGLTLPWFFFSISNPQVSQRLFIPKSMGALKRMCGGFLIFGFVYTVITVLWGFSAKLLCPNLSIADKASPTLLSLSFIPTTLALIAMVAIMAAAISTIDSIMLSLSSMFAKDIYQNIRTKASEEKVLWMGKFIIPVIGIIAFLFARARFGLISTLSVASSTGLLMTVPTIIGAFFWKRGTSAGAIASMVVGAIITATLYITKCYPLGHWPGVWGGITSSVVFIGISLLTRPPRKKAEEFINYLDKTLLEKNAL